MLMTVTVLKKIPNKNKQCFPVHFKQQIALKQQKIFGHGFMQMFFPKRRTAKFYPYLNRQSGFGKMTPSF
jgi:hypothetical protein